MKKALAHRYYRLALGSAKERDLNTALQYAGYASRLDPENTDAPGLAEICKLELSRKRTDEQIPDEVLALIKQKKWAKAARILMRLPVQSVHLLAIEGCLWALAKRSNLFWRLF